MIRYVYDQVREFIKENPDVHLTVEQLRPIEQLYGRESSREKMIIDTLSTMAQQPKKPLPILPPTIPSGLRMRTEPDPAGAQQPKKPLPIPPTLPSGLRMRTDPDPAGAQQPKKPLPIPPTLPSGLRMRNPMETMALALNADHTRADKYSQEDLEKLLLWAEEKYAENPTGVMLADKVFDYVKQIYNRRRLGTNDVTKTMASLSSETGVGFKPTRGRDAVLPLSLRSMDNMFFGTGEVATWANKTRSGFFSSAKMDGVSGLYIDGSLYTRGDAETGRNISHVLEYLGLPDVNYSVRGEIVISNKVFKEKYLGRPGRNNPRNSVAGALTAINHIDKDFLSDLHFVAYEVITDDEMQLPVSRQFEILQHDGFMVAAHRAMASISDETLADYYHELLQSYDYEIDGLVVYYDKPYIRASDKNPEYGRAFKEALEILTAVTTIRDVEWNPSSYGYMIPTVVYDTVSVCGVRLSRATAESARFIMDNGIGIGARIEVIYHGKVNPRIHKVLIQTEPTMPEGPYEWVPSPSGQPIHIKCTETTGENADTITIKRIYKFLTAIDVKNVGETTVRNIFEKSGKKTIDDFLSMTVDDVAFLGSKISVNIISAINEAMSKATMQRLMAGSGCFDRGMGEKVFTKILQKYPDIIENDHGKSEILTIEGVGEITANKFIAGLAGFRKFASDIAPHWLSRIRSNTIKSVTPVKPVAQDPELASGLELAGKNICLTGFRDQSINDFVTRCGGKIQSACSGSTNILVTKASDYQNSKTELAAKKGITIMTGADFKATYMNQ